MMTPHQVEQNIQTLATDAKREQGRVDQVMVRLNALEQHVAELEIAVQRLTGQVAELSAAKRGHGPSA